MEKKDNLYFAVTYKMYSINGNEKKLEEETTSENPLLFLSGFGLTLKAFEENILPIEKDGEFDFTLTCDQAYGEYVKERIVKLDKEIFYINGHFDSENIYKDAIVPLQNEDGNTFLGRVLEIGEKDVTMDLNHPLAGKTLNFTGKVMEKRIATNEEIQTIINQMSGEGCGCGCGSCGGGCGDHQEGCCGGGHCH